MAMTKDELLDIQKRSGLNDTKFAKAIGITRQTWRNWKLGRTIPALAENALRWLDELSKVAPDRVPIGKDNSQS